MSRIFFLPKKNIRNMSNMNSRIKKSFQALSFGIEKFEPFLYLQTYDGKILIGLISYHWKSGLGQT